jgi:hypothetical protein
LIETAAEAAVDRVVGRLFGVLQVLAALSVRGGVGGNSHVPYRDSRLTQLLWEGLRSVGCLLLLLCTSNALAADSS